METAVGWVVWFAYIFGLWRLVGFFLRQEMLALNRDFLERFAATPLGDALLEVAYYEAMTQGDDDDKEING